MEKVVLSNGNEFELVPNATSTSGNILTVTFKPGTKTVEELLSIWEGNDAITVKVDDTSIQVYNNYTRCTAVTAIPDYLISIKHVCPECGVEVAADAKTCDACNAAFEAPTVTEERVKVCVVKVSIPDINDRVADVEDSINDIINTVLG